jgi:hypothetical protein
MSLNMRGAIRGGTGVAVVTGGAHGIGRAIAERFGRSGTAVAIVDVDITGEIVRVDGGRVLSRLPDPLAAGLSYEEKN